MSGIIRQTSRHMGWDHMCSTALAMICVTTQTALLSYTAKSKPNQSFDKGLTLKSTYIRWSCLKPLFSLSSSSSTATA